VLEWRGQRAKRTFLSLLSKSCLDVLTFFCTDLRRDGCVFDTFDSLLKLLTILLSQISFHENDGIKLLDSIRDLPSPDLLPDLFGSFEGP
jgi:hypothetical protein